MASRCPPGPRRARPGAKAQRVAAANSPFCSMVCGAPVWCSSGGRSAVHTMSGTRAWCASTTAGWSSAAAVPLVTQMTVGLPVAIASPSAKNAALRSSRRTWTRSRSAKGRASGVERDPGQTTASVTPSRTHSSTRVALKVACTLTRRATPRRGARLRAAAGPAARLHPDRAPLGPLRGPPGRVAHPGRGGSAGTRRFRFGAGRPARRRRVWWRRRCGRRSATSRAPCSAIRSVPGWRCTWRSAPICP